MPHCSTCSFVTKWNIQLGADDNFQEIVKKIKKHFVDSLGYGCCSNSLVLWLLFKLTRTIVAVQTHLCYRCCSNSLVLSLLLKLTCVSVLIQTNLCYLCCSSSLVLLLLFKLTCVIDVIQTYLSSKLSN